jgi:hypothetical protein
MVVAAGVLVMSTGAQAGVVDSIPVGASWQTNGRVETIVVSGTTAYLGGEFTSVRPSGDPLGTGEVPRAGAAAVDITTGDLLPWNPDVGGTVQTILVNGSTVYLGGSFTTVGGTSIKDLAAVDATSGALTTGFKPKPNGAVFGLALQSGELYVGGSFTKLGGGTVGSLGAVNATTGALDTGFVANVAGAGGAKAKVATIALTTDGSRLVIGGTFTTVNGSADQYLGAVSPATGAVQTWSKHPGFATVAMALDANGVYVAGAGNGGNFDAYAPSTGASLWSAGTDGNVQAIAVMEGIVYVGGHFDNYCSGQTTGQHTCKNPIARDHLLAVDETTGDLESWHPSANGVLGVFALTGADSTLEAGGDFTQLGGVSQQGFAELPEITPPTVTDSAGGQWTNAATVSVTASGSVDNAPGGLTYKYETSTDGGSTWGSLRTGDPATVKAEGQTLVRYEALDPYGNSSGWVEDLVLIDRTAPTVPTIAITPTGCPAPSHTATPSSTDGGSGVAGYAYETSPDDSTWSTPTNAGSLTTSSSEYVRFDATDVAGNTSAWSAGVLIPAPC